MMYNTKCVPPGRLVHPIACESTLTPLSELTQLSAYTSLSTSLLHKEVMICRKMQSYLNTLRQNQTVSQAVAHIVTSNEQQARKDSTQGRQHLIKHSGRYNTTDIITTPPHLRWANEGFDVGNGRKRFTYDDLTLPQWMVGQLTNIHQMQDMVMLKQAMIQVILVAKDATS